MPKCRDSLGIKHFGVTALSLGWSGEQVRMKCMTDQLDFSMLIPSTSFCSFSLVEGVNVYVTLDMHCRPISTYCLFFKQALLGLFLAHCPGDVASSTQCLMQIN